MTKQFQYLAGAFTTSVGMLMSGLVLLVLVGALVTMGQSRRPAPAASYSVLYSFQCETDGANPYASLVRDSVGNLYGTTLNGGAYGLGTVFKFTPDGNETVLHSFGSALDGENPELASLIVDKEGNLYGTTPFGGQFGGQFGGGTVFRVTAAGVETVLYSFTGNADGNEPVGGLVRDRAGNLYGTTEYGGPYQTGIVFELSPAGVETVLHNFGCCFGPSSDGAGPIGGPVRDSGGDLYGTTVGGGASGLGTVFELASDGTETVLHSFAGLPNDGAYGGGTTLLRDPGGNLYGSTYYGGSYDCTIGGFNYGCGTIFKVSSSGTESVLVNFNGRGYGGGPSDGLVAGDGGTLYGTTETGGYASCQGVGCGILFRLTSRGSGREAVLHKFGDSSGDGKGPSAGVIRDPAGNLYGTTYDGGTYGCGTVFKYTP